MINKRGEVTSILEIQKRAFPVMRLGRGVEGEKRRTVLTELRGVYTDQREVGLRRIL